MAGSLSSKPSLSQRAKTLGDLCHDLNTLAWRLELQSHLVPALLPRLMREEAHWLGLLVQHVLLEEVT